MIFQVIVDISNSNVDKVFDYKGEDFFQIGQRVLVPFGNREIEGFIVGAAQDSSVPAEKLKNIIWGVDNFVAITPEMMELSRYMQTKYHLRLIDCLRLFIPSQMRGGRVKTVYLKLARLTEKYTKDEILLQISKQAKSQRALVDFLYEHPDTLTTTVNKQFGASLRTLVKSGLVTISEIERSRTPYSLLKNKGIEHNLTASQQQIVDKVLTDVDNSYLLFGVTGSGKTEVYMNVISQVVAQGKSAIMLVPEISLTPNMLQLFRSRYGDNVAILHSGLSAGERFDEWIRLLRGEARIGIGARSAIFAPLNDLGVIIIDEEHDSSYQSETNPRYNTLEIADFRRKYNKCALILGSATPSLESYYKALHGQLRLLELPERINKQPLPEVEIVDMANQMRQGNREMFSVQLKEELDKCIKEGNQAMLFLNRRGFSSFVMCTKCGYVAKCENCDVSLTYHSEERELRCHYCGKRYRMFDNCPNCKSPYIRQGKVGTQQVVAYLKRLYPDVKVLRMDYDTTQSKEAHSKILESFGNREAQILVGTQMIAKGHDFPFVTLVGILDGDQSLYYSDYMSAERTFQLITQVSGRSGRDKLSGKVILQTYSPKHYCLILAARQDYISFYKKEINLREVAKFPPFAVIMRVLYSGLDSESCVSQLNAHFAEIEKLKVNYPLDFLYLQRMRCAIKRIESKFRYQILLRLTSDKADEIIQQVYAITDKTNTKDVSVFCEINPQSMN